MFNVNTAYSSYPGCVFEVGEYANNKHIAIGIFDDEGPVSNLTVNIPGIEMYPKNYSCIDTNNFPEGKNLADQLRIGEHCGALRSGFCIYPVYKFDIEKVKEFTK